VEEKSHLLNHYQHQILNQKINQNLNNLLPKKNLIKNQRLLLFHSLKKNLRRLRLVEAVSTIKKQILK
jgi:hypothetical protein